MLSKIKEASDYIRSKIEKTPNVAVVLGSGLGIYVDQIKNKTIIPFDEIPHFHATSVVGHVGRVVVGTVGDVVVCAFQGRFHFYEGHSLEDVCLPVRVIAKLGIKNLILTNASGGINPKYSEGDLCIITDHINLTGQNPLIGKNIDELGARFPDMTNAYKPHLRELIHSSASELNIKIQEGVYAGLSGPTYETPAEIRMLRVLGADLVGMSTVPEVIAANHAGLNVCAISCITNMAAGMKDEELKHDDVKDVAGKAMHSFSDLVNKCVLKIGNL
jgi:purine-nucleoside phosphorylase